MTGLFSAYLRNTGQGLRAPFHSAAVHASLLGVLIRRDLANRTSGTMLGGFWPLIQTALQVLGFWFLFDVIYGMRFYFRPWSVIFSMIKATFFGFAISFIACYIGLRGRGGAEGVGRTTTTAVVTTTIALMILDVTLAPMLKWF